MTIVASATDTPADPTSAAADPAAAATRRLRELAPIGLDELVERAALQTRVDRKYIVPLDALDVVLAGLGDRTRVLEMNGIRDFRYESVYFDTPELTSYWMAAHARRRRFKMRTRAYVDSATAYLEVKTRGARASTVKDRLEYAFDDRTRLNHDGLAYVSTTLDDAGFDQVAPDALRSTLSTRYRRTTLFVPGAAAGGLGEESRATIDTHLSWHLDPALRSPAVCARAHSTRDRDDRSLGRPAVGTTTPAHHLETPGIVIVETKSDSRPSAVDRILWASRHRPSNISKYGTGLAALNPQLPANKWSRTLRRHFTAA